MTGGTLLSIDVLQLSDPVVAWSLGGCGAVWFLLWITKRPKAAASVALSTGLTLWLNGKINTAVAIAIFGPLLGLSAVRIFLSWARAQKADED